METNQAIVIAVIGLLGVVVGGFLSLLAGVVVKRREHFFSIQSKIIDRRIIAHEYALSVAAQLRETVLADGIGEDGEVNRYPGIMSSDEILRSWIGSSVQPTSKHFPWLDISVVRHLNLIQDYLISLVKSIEDVQPEDYPRVGVIVRDDFIRLSHGLEVASLDYIAKGVYGKITNTAKEHHKFQRVRSESEIKSMRLFTRWEEISSIIEQGKLK